MATLNLQLDLPTVSVTLGPEWATKVNTAFEVIDDHDHTSGKGRQVPSAGLNINDALNFNGFELLDAGALGLQSLSSNLTGLLNILKLHSVGGDLYFTNSSGTAVQVTSGSTIAAAPGSAQVYEYQAVSGDLLIGPADSFVFLGVDTTSIRNITLPAASSVSPGRIFKLKDVSGLSDTNNINILTSASDLVDGESSQALGSNFGSFEIVSDGVSNWYIS